MVECILPEVCNEVVVLDVPGVCNGVVVLRKEEQLASATDAPGDIDGHFLDENRGQDTRPILLFDPNGTLNTLTATQYASRRVVVRPGLEHLRRLQEVFCLGIFSSAYQSTLQNVLPAIEAAAGPGQPLFSNKSLILYRGHTEKASAAHMEAGGNEWDTVKPLHKWFKHLDRVLLIDDVADKTFPGEEDNMILVHCWKEEAEDIHLKLLVDSLLEVYHNFDEEDDVRTSSRKVLQMLQLNAVSHVEQVAES